MSILVLRNHFGIIRSMVFARVGIFHAAFIMIMTIIIIIIITCTCIVILVIIIITVLLLFYAR